MREAMSHKELRRVVRAMVVKELRHIEKIGKNYSELELTAQEVVGDDGDLGLEVRVRDLALPAPPKGERPWHIYRVVVQERQA